MQHCNTMQHFLLQQKSDATKSVASLTANHGMDSNDNYFTVYWLECWWQSDWFHNSTGYGSWTSVDIQIISYGIGWWMNMTKTNGKGKTASIFEEWQYESMAKEYGLNARQELFCMYYLRYQNASKAYRLAYGCSARVANVNGSRLLKKPKIQGFYRWYRNVVCIGAGLNVEKAEQNIIFLDSIFATNPYHWNKPYQPF